MADITIRHTPADGTLIEGSSRGDGVWEVLLGLRKQGQGNWRVGRSVGLYLGQSRDKDAQTWKITKAQEALEAAGHTVTVEIDNTDARSFAEAEQERYERADERAERYGQYAENAAGRSEAAWKASHALVENIPFGQPILVGHHSERGHRRALDRSWNLLGRSVEEDKKAEYHEGRADAAAGYQAGREAVGTTLRRIEKLQAEKRTWQRGMERYRSEAYAERAARAIARLDEEIAHWEGVIKRRQEEEGIKVWTRADFTKGDYVRFLGKWFEVIRVNGKSVTIPAMINDGLVIHKDGNRCTWTDTVAYHKVTGRKSAAEIAEAVAKAEAASQGQEAG